MELILQDDFKLVFGSSDLIDSSNSIIDLYTHSTANIFGVLTLTNGGGTKTIEFVKYKDGLRKARLLLENEDVPNLKSSTFHLYLLDVGFYRNTNTLFPVYDQPKIKQSVRAIYNKDIAELKTQIATIKRAIEALSKGKALGITVKTDDDAIKQGMVPVALDNGEFIAAYPFNDCVKRINGVQAVGGEVTLGSENINYKGVTIEAYIQNLAEAIQGLDRKLNAVVENDMALRKRLDDLEIAFATYKNSGLV